MATDPAALRVDAHVLVQLGQELVTDVEQAILECVKNAYDADAPGCSIVVRTDEDGELAERGPWGKLAKFGGAAENVEVRFTDLKGRPIEFEGGSPTRTLPPGAVVERKLHWQGYILIEDKGAGLNETQLRDSWLVISNSAKRAESREARKKKTTDKGRTPLGDKGLGRLGTMKLGDILEIDTAQKGSSEVAHVRFRWADCDAAFTVDEIPVHFETRPNAEKLKGTQVFVRGLKELGEWKRAGRAAEIAKSLARLISPFEATSTFPVSVDVDGDKHTLVGVTNELLKRAVAEFEFHWENVNDAWRLRAVARFRDKLFKQSSTASQRAKTEAVFEGQGQAFISSLKQSKRMTRFEVSASPPAGWFLEVSQTLASSSVRPTGGPPASNPGPFEGAFYYFHLNDLDTGSAAGVAIDRAFVKEMAGISILRDGFTVRAHGDWLKLSEGMTSGSVYNLRFHNTLGYFALTGEENWRLVEKSDREGFVEDAAYRGFMAVALACKKFANDSLEEVRRAADEFVRKLTREEAGTNAPKTAERSLDVVEETVKFAADAQQGASELLAKLEQGLDAISTGESREGIGAIREAIKKAKNVQRALEAGRHASSAVTVLREDLAENKERILALYESAAVGLSARGLAHELRTHLTEIRKRLANVQKIYQARRWDESAFDVNVRAIRISCSSISSAAALIDPLLPRTRTIREKIELEAFVKEYVENRKASLDNEEITFHVVSAGGPVNVRFNRGRLLAVLDNLVRNSVYWLRRGQAVMGVRRPKSITVRLLPDGFMVSDSGPGVDPRYEESLFEIFISAKPEADKGQGLGLFIVSQLLEAEGCAISLAPDRNEEGRRNTFVVNLGPVLE